MPPRWEEERAGPLPFPFLPERRRLPFCEGAVVSHKSPKPASRRSVSKQPERGYDFVGVGVAFFEGFELGFADGLALPLGEIEGVGVGFRFGGGEFEITIFSM